MNDHSARTSLVHAALFVDFDNLYIALSQQDTYVATQFATNPGHWLAWLEDQMPVFGTLPEASRRRILIRRCYLNPQAFGHFRPYFIRSAFEVIDCPPLTARGKTSTDIHMVMDALDALSHPTPVHEFIVLSGDADFTPLLLRLRKHGRYSAVLSAGYVSPAYKASSDYLISQDVFLRDGLGITEQDEDVTDQAGRDEESGHPSDTLLGKMASRLHAAAVLPDGIEASDLPDVYKEFPEFRLGNHWLGFFSLRRLTEALVLRRDDLAIVEEDPWRVVRTEYARPAGSVPLPVWPSGHDTVDEPMQQDVRTAVAEWIRQTVASSPTPVAMAVLAQTVLDRFAGYVSSSDWLGEGTFKNLLQTLQLGNLELLPVGPGYLYDPGRHEPAAPSAEGGDERELGRPQPMDAFSLRHSDLAPLARKVSRLTDTPYLMPEHYAILLRELAREINERGYQITRTSKTVRDRCVERGAPVARSHVNFVLIGIGHTGHHLGQDLPETAERLGAAVVQNTLNLCRLAQLDVTSAEVEQIRRWIIGGLSPAVEVRTDTGTA
jgi:hypothetical protein